MRPAISDSLISGQPLYLLYWNSKSFDAVPAFMLLSFATQATGSVRLQVTGRPPTTSGSLRADLSPAQAPRASGTAEASAPLRTCRRSNLEFMRHSRRLAPVCRNAAEGSARPHSLRL